MMPLTRAAIGRLWHALTNSMMNRCRVCGSSENVIWYDHRGIWAYFFRNTYCPDHCPDHSYVYEPGYGHACEHCGAPPDQDWFDCD